MSKDPTRDATRRQADARAAAEAARQQVLQELQVLGDLCDQARVATTASHIYTAESLLASIEFVSSRARQLAIEWQAWVHRAAVTH